jgi:hypothetical protein
MTSTLLLLCGLHVGPAGAEPVRLPSYRQLFLDDRLIVSSKGLRRVFHSAEKCAANPVLKGEKPWEGKGPYVYGTAMYDSREQLFKLWYNCYGSSEKICNTTPEEQAP